MKINVTFNSDKEKRNFKMSMVIIAILASFVSGFGFGFNMKHGNCVPRKQYETQVRNLRNMRNGLEDARNDLGDAARKGYDYERFQRLNINN